MTDPMAVAAGNSQDLAAAWLELLALADADADADDDAYDDDRASVLVQLLQADGNLRYVELALPLLADVGAGRRQLAAWLLGQFGYPEGRPFGEVVAPALAAAALVETNGDVRVDLVTALGFAEDPAWSTEVARYAADRHPAVRMAVARSMPSLFGDADLDAAAVATLITLTADQDPEVRDWATFALGTQSDLDTPAIREALFARLDDNGGDTAFEATLGLARRGDVRVSDRLARRLATRDATIFLMDLEAAAALADPMLLPQLLELQTTWDDDDHPHIQALRIAIARSRPENFALTTDLEHQLVALTNAALTDTGWTIALDGGYPQTSVVVIRPDGSPEPGSRRWLLWEEMTPELFAPQQRALQWEHFVRQRASR